MNKRVEAIIGEIKKLNTVTFEVVTEIGKRIKEVQDIIDGEDFEMFCKEVHISKADCSRYVAVVDHMDVFEKFPQLKELGTSKIFALLSIIKDGSIEDFITNFGVNTSFKEMKKNIKSHRTGSTGEGEEAEEGEDSDSKDEELAKLKAKIAQLEQDNHNLKVQNRILKRRSTSASTGAIDRKITNKILKFIHPDRFARFGDDVVIPLTEASKIINGLAG